MNRQLKFRVWAGAAMEYNIMAGFLGAYYVQGINENDTASLSEFNTKYLDKCPVMQFSGLLDCKGKEIYESDVLRETIEHDMGDENLYYVVKWFQPTCSFVAMSYADTVTDWEDSEEEYPTPLTPEDCKRLTVCGNEHQNPDWFTKD